MVATAHVHIFFNCKVLDAHKHKREHELEYELKKKTRVAKNIQISTLFLMSFMKQTCSHGNNNALMTKNTQSVDIKCYNLFPVFFCLFACLLFYCVVCFWFRF